MEATNKLQVQGQMAQMVQRSGVKYFSRQLFKKRSAQIGGAVVALLIFFALFAPWVVPYDPFDVQTEITFNAFSGVRQVVFKR